MTHTSAAQGSAHCVTVSVCPRRAQPCLSFRWFQESHSTALRAPPSFACPTAAVEPSVDESPLAARLLFLLRDHWSWDGLIFLRVWPRFPCFLFFLWFLSLFPERGGWQPKLPFLPVHRRSWRMWTSVRNGKDCVSTLRCFWCSCVRFRE